MLGPIWQVSHKSAMQSSSKISPALLLSTHCNAWMRLPKQEELDDLSFKVLKPNDDNDNDNDNDDDDDGEYTNQTPSQQSFSGRQKWKWNA